MKREIEILPPRMPNFVMVKQKPGLKQDGFKTSPPGIDIADFTNEEAIEYADMMRETFIKHWMSRRSDKHKG